MNEDEALQVAYTLIETKIRALTIAYRENEVNGSDNEYCTRELVKAALEFSDLCEVMDETMDELT